MTRIAMTVAASLIAAIAMPIASFDDAQADPIAIPAPRMPNVRLMCPAAAFGISGGRGGRGGRFGLRHGVRDQFHRSVSVCGRDALRASAGV